MSYSVGIIMDPIDTIKPYKDTSFAMMLEAQERDATIYYMELKHLFIEQGVAKAIVRPLKVFDVDKDSNNNYYEFTQDAEIKTLGEFDVLLMRKDPPFDSEFLYTTHMLSLAEEQGALVVNNPQSLRDFNEKLFTSWFADDIPSTLVARDDQQLRDFHAKHGTVICKPLDGMGGTSIFKVNAAGDNLGVIIETLTENYSRFMMMQAFMPEIADGDKRILIVDGEVMPYALARIPSAGETRGNIAAGGMGRPQPLSDSDFAVASKVSPLLKQKGLLFVGLDMIGDKITEINVTSPTCVREIEAAYPVKIISRLFDAIEDKLQTKSA